MLAEGIVFLHEKGFIIADNFAYGIDWSSEKNAEVLAEQLDILIEYYLNHNDTIPSRLLSVKIEYLSLNIMDSRMCGIGTGMRVYDNHGILYPCHLFEPLSIGNESSLKARTIDFERLENYIDPQCKDCPILNVCPTCYGANYAATGDIAKRDKNMCILSKISVMASAKLLYKKIAKYGIDSVSEDKALQKAIVESIMLLQRIEWKN